MSLVGLLLGVINIIIVVVILVLIGAVIMWVMSALGWAVPQLVQRLYMAVVALIALYMLVALLLGIPTMRVIGSQHGFWFSGFPSAVVAIRPTASA